MQGHFEFFAVFQNVRLFIPQIFTKALTMLCGTLDDKHSRWMKPRRRVSGRSFKAQVSRNKEFHWCFCIQTHIRQRDNQGWVYWHCWIWKKAFYEWCGHPRQTHHLFQVQLLFCFLAVSWIDEMYVHVCNVDANINVLNKKKVYILGSTHFKFLSRIKWNSINIICLKFIFSIGGSYGNYSPQAPKILAMQLQSLLLLLFLCAQAFI